ncbi:MAG: hypothetical protein NXI10_06645 [bacterium]|nr:hypothetical protein [bacterium]
MQKWTFIISIALLFAACADLKKSEQEDRIAAMETKLDALEKELNDFDEALWKTWTTDAELATKQLKQLEADTIPLEMALQIDNYRKLKEKLPGLQKGQQNCLNQVKAIRKRLKKLKTDIENGNGRRDKYDEFLSTEEQELEILEEKFALYKSTYDELQSDFPAAQEQVNAIIAERNLAEEVQ